MCSNTVDGPVLDDNYSRLSRLVSGEYLMY